MKKIKNGFFITVEGIDGSGKSSIVNYLTAELNKQNFHTIKTKEPGGTNFGISLRKMLEDVSGTIDSKAEFFLFAADRSQHMNSLVRPNLEQGTIVISDRGPDSSLAYQAFGKGLDIKFINAINNWILALHTPNLVIYLKLDYDTALNRVIKRGEKISSYEKSGSIFFEKVINGFEVLFSKRSNVIEIDASLPQEEVKALVLSQVLSILEKQEIF